jgi:hypothetical protein
MRKSLMAGIAAATAACQAPAAPEPDYPAPGNRAAEQAYEAALGFDGYENLADESRAERLSAFRYQLEVGEARRERTREDTQTALAALRRVDVQSCSWRTVRRSDIPDWARDRVQTAPPGAYECAFTLYFQRSGPPPGPRLTEDATGLFFMREGAWVYMGCMPNPYN